MKKNVLWLLLCLVIQGVQAQTQRSIRGTVFADNGGEPLPGVSITIRGTTTGTTSNGEGSYTLTVPANAVLVFSYIGYARQEVPVGNRSTIDVRMMADTRQLSEVVVVGYGTQVKRDVTGAVSTVKGAELATLPVPSFDAALQGRAAGLQVTQASGAPGGVVRVLVRGTSSISSGTEPLYVIDGMVIYQDISGIGSGRTSNTLNPLSNLNPNDIESIEVLKDAAATAIYGSRGANGVIIVTTKTGKRGQARTTIDLNRGVSNAVKTIDYASGSQWLQLVDEARRNSIGFGIPANQEKFDPMVLSNNALPTPAGISGAQFGPLPTWNRQLAEQTNTNWVDQVLQQGQITEANLSTSNGFDKGAFFISGQYRDEEGVLKTHRLTRYAARANLDFSPTNKIRAGAKINFSYLQFSQPQIGIGNNGGGIGRQNFGATGGWGQANLGSLPIMPVYNPDGTYFDPLRGRNVVAGQDPSNFSNLNYQNRTIGTAFVEYTLLPGLAIHGEASADFLNSNGIYWASDVIRYNRVAQEEGRFVNNRSANIYATFNRQFAEKHELQATAGYEIQKTVQRRQDYAFEGVVGNQQEIGEIANGATQFVVGVSGIFGDQFFRSMFGRVNYKYNDRYLLGLSFRRDGSTAFGPNNRYGNFPAASAGWIISSEEFAQQSSFLRQFNLLKLRASYGQTGNANIRSFAYLNNYVNWPVYGQSAALGFSVLANPDIRWEKNEQMDAAVEFGLLNNRLSGSVGVYNRVSRDMLLNVPVAPNVGIGPGSSVVITNIGDLRNRGFELQLGTVNIDRGGFRWTTDFNFSTVNNKILKLTPQFQVLPSGSLPIATGIQQGVSITQIGGRLSTFYLAEYAGLDSEGFETIYEIDQNALRQTGKTVKTGNMLRATQANINANRIVQDGKTALPTWFGGLTNTFSYKGIELNTLFTFQGGNYIYDSHEESTVYVRTGANVIRADVIGNTWSESNKSAIYPKPTWNLRDNNLNANGQPAPQTLGTRTTRFLYKGDFLRLKTLQLSYTLPRSVVGRLKMQNVRIYGNAQNLLTFTRYPGLDPELVVLGDSQTRNLGQGFVGNLPLPQVRAYNAGISVTF
ncbi:TonB-dependent receptor [Nibrella saemangeumensis]|uniref:TonB-dependent receptor n=1 Tax=Nibrella saemangeumensis TaxID=1084526 RepID=A0ABP8NIB7_9BACT